MDKDLNIPVAAYHNNPVVEAFRGEGAESLNARIRDVLLPLGDGVLLPARQEGWA